MVDLTNLFTQIIAPFNTDSSVKIPNGHTSNTGNQTVDDFNDVKSATGGKDSALSELINKSRNWKPTEPEAPRENF
jgi:hypothetical protein